MSRVGAVSPGTGPAWACSDGGNAPMDRPLERGHRLGRPRADPSAAGRTNRGRSTQDYLYNEITV